MEKDTLTLPLTLCERWAEDNDIAIIGERDDTSNSADWTSVGRGISDDFNTELTTKSINGGKGSGNPNPGQGRGVGKPGGLSMSVAQREQFNSLLDKRKNLTSQMLSSPLTNKFVPGAKEVYEYYEEFQEFRDSLYDSQEELEKANHALIDWIDDIGEGSNAQFSKKDIALSKEIMKELGPIEVFRMQFDDVSSPSKKEKVSFSLEPGWMEKYEDEYEGQVQEYSIFSATANSNNTLITPEMIQAGWISSLKNSKESIVKFNNMFLTYANEKEFILEGDKIQPELLTTQEDVRDAIIDAFNKSSLEEGSKY